MEQNERKAKLLKVVSVVLPIVLVGILAATIVIAMNIANEAKLQQVLGTNVSTTTTPDPDPDPTPDPEPDKDPEPDDDPVEDYFSEGLSYKSFGNGTCALVGLGECEDAYIIVPSESPDGDSVIEIANNAFKNCASIKGIEFPETLTRIGAYAFYGSSLRSVTVTAKINEIDSYAFCGCRSLTAINVDEDNSDYSCISGALYNKSGTVLITYPAGKGENFCIISNKVTEISNMAFYKCSSIKKVTYHGTEAQWALIEIGAGNESIEEAILFFAGSEGK